MSKRNFLVLVILSFWLLSVSCTNRELPHGTEVALPGGQLPDKEYTPPTAPTRYFADTTLELIPQSSYGRIWPYIGGYAEVYWMRGELFGLCDENGKIICDPAYSQVDIIELNGKKIYVLTKNMMDKEYKDVSKITLAALDGSWAHEYDDIEYISDPYEYSENTVLFRPQSVLYDYITVCKNDKWGVIDDEGRELLPCIFEEPICFTTGLAAVLSEDKLTYSYIDIAGNIVLGPFEVPPQVQNIWDGAPLPLTNDLYFCEGNARFYDDGRYGVIDVSGEILIPAEYDFISSFHKGKAQFIIGQQSGVFNSSGSIIFGPTDESFWLTDDGAIVLQLPEAQFKFDTDTGERTLWFEPHELKYEYADGILTVKRDDIVLTLTYEDHVSVLDNGNFTVSHKDKGTWEIIDRTGTTIAGPYDGQVNSTYMGLIYVEDSESNTVIYSQNGLRLPGPLITIIPLDGKYLVRQQDASGLIDESGNWVIRVPLYDYLSD